MSFCYMCDHFLRNISFYFYVTFEVGLSATSATTGKEGLAFNLGAMTRGVLEGI